MYRHLAVDGLLCLLSLVVANVVLFRAIDDRSPWLGLLGAGLILVNAVSLVKIGTAAIAQASLERAQRRLLSNREAHLRDLAVWDEIRRLQGYDEQGGDDAPPHG